MIREAGSMALATVVAAVMADLQERAEKGAGLGWDTTTTGRVGVDAQAGKVVRLRWGLAEVALRLGADGVFRPVHRSVRADAEIKIPLARALGAREPPLLANGDSELLALLADRFKHADLSLGALVERFLGPQAGAAAANGWENVRLWSCDAGKRSGTALRAWLIKEAALVPDPDRYARHVRRLGAFSARVERLRASLEGL